MTITTEKPHGLQVGDRAQIGSKRVSIEVTVTAVIDLKTFRCGP